jgi:TRAP-type C4-dicarboxylate transport system substrate-binding protein
VSLKRIVLPLVFLTAAAAVAAAPVTVRLSSIAPVGTTWDAALKDMGAAWSKATEGRVLLRVTGGGSQGSEPTVLKAMRPEVNSVDAALLTATGLADVDPGFNVFGIPFFFRSDEEAQAVRAKVEPVLTKRLEAKHLRLLAWGHGGWVQLFSTTPVKTIADVKKLKLFTSAGDAPMMKWYTSNGFNPVALDVTNIAQGLTTGMIQETPMPPYGASVLQVYRSAKYMVKVDVDPLIGALIMTDTMWNKIAAEDRDKLVGPAKALEKRLETEVPALDEKAVKEMQARGLTVTPLDAKALTEFRTEADKLAGTMRGSMVPAEIYDLAVQARDEYRKSHGNK